MAIKSVIKGALKSGGKILKGAKSGIKAVVKGIKGGASKLMKGAKSAGRALLTKMGWVSKPKGELFKDASKGAGVMTKIKETIDKGKVAVRDLMNPMTKGKEKVLGKGANQPRTLTTKMRTGTGMQKVPYEPPIKMSKKAKGRKPITKKALNEGLGQPNPLLRSKL